MLDFENLDKFIFPGTGSYDIPVITADPNIEPHRITWIPFNYAKTEKDPAGKGVHFFVDDYQFARLWNRPDTYIPLLQRFAAVCAPDFSTYTDMPKAMQIYNHYRKHWLGAYWQARGIKVVPTISWSDESSYEWCFDGEPKDSVVAISSVGCMADAESTRLFMAGYNEMMKRLTPTQIIFYGKCPAECDWNAVKIEAHYERIKRERIAKHGR